MAVGGTSQRYFNWTLAFKEPNETSDFAHLYIVAYKPECGSIGRKKDSLLEQGICCFSPAMKWGNDESAKFLFETDGPFQTVGQNELVISWELLEKNGGVYIGSVFLMKSEASLPLESESLYVTVRIPNNSGTLLQSIKHPNFPTQDVNLTPTSNQPLSRLTLLKGGVGSLDDSGFFSPANTPSPLPRPNFVLRSDPGYTHAELKAMGYTPPSSGEEFDGYVASESKSE